MSATSLYNGTLVEGEAWARSRGLHYGDGVFRTICVHDGVCVDWFEQRAKLLADAARLDLQLEARPLQALEQEAATLACARGEGTLKILLWRQAAERGYAPAGTSVERLLISGPSPAHAPQNWTQGIVAIDSPVRLATPHALAGTKHLNRLEQVLASRDWPADAQEALMQDGQGNVVCGTRSNLFWVQGKALRTPRVDRGGVAGVMRARVLDLATQLGLDAGEAQAPRSALDAADELFVTNSLIGIWPLRKLGARELVAPGPITRQLMKALQHPRMP